MMPRELVSPPALERRPLDDIHARPVVSLHVEIDRHEVLRLPAVQIPRNGERFEKNFRHDHRAPEIEHDSTITDSDQSAGEASKVSMTRVANRRAVRGGMLMNDLGTESRVN